MDVDPEAAVARTARLLLRHPVPGDRHALGRLLTDPEVMRHIGDGRPLTDDGAGRWIDAATAPDRVGGIGILVVVAAVDVTADVTPGTVLGWCGVEIGEDTGRPELVYALASAVHGRGLGGEAVTAVIDLVDRSDHPDLVGGVLEATVDPANTASRRLLIRHGFHVVVEAPDVHGIPTLYCRREHARP